MGCYRLSDQPAEVTLRFSVDGAHQTVVIPEGTLVAATDNVVFATETEVRINGTEAYVDVVGICKAQAQWATAGRLGK